MSRIHSLLEARRRFETAQAKVDLLESLLSEASPNQD